MKILVLNSGSSSQKACLYEIGDVLPENPPKPLWAGRIEWHRKGVSIVIRNCKGAAKTWTTNVSCRKSLLTDLLTTSWSGETAGITSASEIDVVGHRLVHGGTHFRNSVVITQDVYSALADLVQFAPLHIPAALDEMNVVMDLLGDVPQIAAFDTTFHQDMSPTAQTYSGPYEWQQLGIRRYGFHGISHQYCAARAAQLLGKDLRPLRVVSCHLGNGCSLAAVKDGRSVDTTMGFTPMDGLMMGTRSGSIDPGILIFLMRQQALTADQIDEMLNKRSGLLGISGISSDMRAILTAKHAGDKRAKLAFDVYVHRLRTAIGGMAAVLEGIDALVFTAGVGENSPELRAAACTGLAFLGLTLNAKQNEHCSPDAVITGAESRVNVLVIRAEEDWAIAKDCWQLTSSAAAMA